MGQRQPPQGGVHLLALVGRRHLHEIAAGLACGEAPFVAAGGGGREGDLRALEVGAGDAGDDLAAGGRVCELDRHVALVPCDRRLQGEGGVLTEGDRPTDDVGEELSRPRPGEQARRPSPAGVAGPRNRTAEAVLPGRQDRIVGGAAQHHLRRRLGRGGHVPVHGGQGQGVGPAEGGAGSAELRRERSRHDPRLETLLGLLEEELGQLRGAVGLVEAASSRLGQGAELGHELGLGLDVDADRRDVDAPGGDGAAEAGVVVGGVPVADHDDVFVGVGLGRQGLGGGVDVGSVARRVAELGAADRLLDPGLAGRRLQGHQHARGAVGDPDVVLGRELVHHRPGRSPHHRVRLGTLHGLEHKDDGQPDAEVPHPGLQRLHPSCAERGGGHVDEGDRPVGGERGEGVRHPGGLRHLGVE